MLLLAFAFTLHCAAQLEWVSESIPAINCFHRSTYKTKKNRFFVLCNNAPNYDFTDRIIVLDSLGKTLKILNAMDYSYPQVSEFYELVESPDSNITFLTLNGVVDDWGNAFLFGGLLKMDDDLNYEVLATFGYSVSEKGVALQDGSYILFSTSDNFINNDTRLTKRTTEGIKLWELPLPVTDNKVYDLATTQTDSILVTTKNGLIVIDSGGIIAHTYPQYLFHQIEVDDQDWLTGARDDSLFLLSPGLALVAEWGFEGDTIKDISMNDGKTAVLTRAGMVYVFGDSLALSGSFQLTADSRFDEVIAGADRLTLAGEERFGLPDPQKGSSHSFVKEYAFDGDDFNLSNDLGVTAIAQDGETYIVHTFATTWDVFLKDVRVTVHNFGANPVDSFILYHNYFQTRKFTGLALQPGQTIELYLEETMRRFYTEPAGKLYDFCMWTSSPDGRLDENNANDIHCMEMVVADGEVLPASDFNLFPNPAGMGQVRYASSLSLPDEATILLSGLDGRLLRRWSIAPGQQEAVFSLEGVSGGIYFWIMETQGKIMKSGKLVVLN